jgi:hypothetical protein
LVMLKDIIVAWIREGCPVDGGVSIYLKHISPNAFYMANVSRKPEAMARDTLLNEFSLKLKVPIKLLKDEAFPVVVVETVENSEDTHEDHSDINAEDKRDIEERGVRLRDEFPFLDDATCPDILKVLVADMLRDHAAYLRNHPKLFDVHPDDNDACYEAAKNVVVPYINNRKIWDELNYYKANGKLLGKHAKMEEMNEIDLLRAKTTVELLTDVSSRFPRQRSYQRGMIDKYKKKGHKKLSEWRNKEQYYTRMIEAGKAILAERG